MVVLDKYNLSLAIFQANISSTRVELFAFPLREVRKEGEREGGRKTHTDRNTQILKTYTKGGYK